MSRPNFDRLPPPPRAVGWPLRLYALFAEPFSQVGWCLLAFSSIFVWTFAIEADVSSVLFRGDVATALGRVTAVRDTRASENRSRVSAVSYSFRPGDGTQRTGTSYTTGSPPAPGDMAMVEYLPDHPTVSRIQGMRRTLFGPAALAVLIFPTIGLLLVGFGFRSRRSVVRLLVDGLPAAGTLVGRERTNVSVNNRPVIALTFEFAAGDGRRHRTVARSSQPEPLTDETQETLLYLPERPEQATLVDDLPASVQADEMGELHLASPRLAVLALVVPLVTVAGNVACALVRASG